MACGCRNCILDSTARKLENLQEPAFSRARLAGIVLVRGGICAARWSPRDLNPVLGTLDAVRRL